MLTKFGYLENFKKENSHLSQLFILKKIKFQNLFFIKEITKN